MFCTPVSVSYCLQSFIISSCVEKLDPKNEIRWVSALFKLTSETLLYIFTILVSSISSFNLHKWCPIKRAYSSLSASNASWVQSKFLLNREAAINADASPVKRMAEYGLKFPKLGVDPKEVQMGYVRGPSVTPPKNLGVAVGKEKKQWERNQYVEGVVVFVSE